MKVYEPCYYTYYDESKSDSSSSSSSDRKSSSSSSSDSKSSDSSSSSDGKGNDKSYEKIVGYVCGYCKDDDYSSSWCEKLEEACIWVMGGPTPKEPRRK